MNSCVATLGVCASILFQTEDNPPVREIERQCLAHREGLRSGVVRLTSIVTRHDPTSSTTRKKNVALWFDGLSLRTDYLTPYLDKEAAGDKPTYRESVSLHKGVFRNYSNRVPAAGGEIITTMWPATDERAKRLLTRPDPRLIGMVGATYENLVHYRTDGFRRMSSIKVTRTRSSRRRRRSQSKSSSSTGRSRKMCLSLWEWQCPLAEKSTTSRERRRRP